MVGPSQIWLVSLLKRRNLDTAMYIFRMPGEDEGRGNFPGGPVVKTLLPKQEVQAQSLASELRSTFLIAKK